MATPEKFPDRLTQKLTEFDDETFVDYLSVMASKIEDSMIQSGGIPGKDYTFVDIFNMATAAYGKSPKRLKFGI